MLRYTHKLCTTTRAFHTCTTRSMLDIGLFRAGRPGGNPDLVRESQRKRFAKVELVDQVIEADEQWRKLRSKLDTLLMYSRKVSNHVGMKKKAKTIDNGDSQLDNNFEYLNETSYTDDTLRALTVSQLVQLSKRIKTEIEQVEITAKQTQVERDQSLSLIGNIVHDSVYVDNDEDNNQILKEHGEKKSAKLNHYDIMEKLGGLQTVPGTKIAGERAYFITGDLVRLNLALQAYGLDFLHKRGYDPIYPPFFMNKETMEKVAQLEQFDEELYRVSGDGDAKYLIATSEQPIAAYYADKWMEKESLPKRFAGLSTCFRKEAGKHGKDMAGIFRVHQFEKVEQFIVTDPKTSWERLDEMIKYSEEFYESLGLSYRVVSIVSGKLNNAASKKIDLEAWFPASQSYRELVSCSNCTDYQARRVGTRYGQGKTSDEKEFVHMLNGTLCATTRTMCCIVENYQTEDGVIIPPVLRPFMSNTEKILFRTNN